MKKLVISFFVILNITTVLYANRPAFVEVVRNKILDENLSKVAAYNIKYVISAVERKLQLYGYLAGLGNHWIMFGFQSHFNWWYKIKAKYANGEEVLLPLARQSKRTFWQWFLFDFKEAKIFHNLYSNRTGRENYAKYLCRQYTHHNNFPIESIEWEVYWQQILEPKEARKKGFYLAPDVSSSLLDSFKCPKVQGKS